MKNDVEIAEDELKIIASKKNNLKKDLKKRLTLKENLKRIEQFSDSTYLASELREIAEDFEFADRKTKHFLKETADRLEGLFKLTIDIQKNLNLHKIEDEYKDPKLLRVRDVLEITGLTSTSMYELMKTDEFPKCCRITKRCSGWVKSEVTTWIRQKMQDREI